MFAEVSEISNNVPGCLKPESISPFKKARSDFMLSKYTFSGNVLQKILDKKTKQKKKKKKHIT